MECMSAPQDCICPRGGATNAKSESDSGAESAMHQDLTCEIRASGLGLKAVVSLSTTPPALPNTASTCTAQIIRNSQPFENITRFAKHKSLSQALYFYRIPAQRMVWTPPSQIDSLRYCIRFVCNCTWVEIGGRERRRTGRSVRCLSIFSKFFWQKPTATIRSVSNVIHFTFSTKMLRKCRIALTLCNVRAKSSS